MAGHVRWVALIAGACAAEPRPRDEEPPWIRVSAPQTLALGALGNVSAVENRGTRDETTEGDPLGRDVTAEATLRSPATAVSRKRKEKSA